VLILVHKTSPEDKGKEEERAKITSKMLTLEAESRVD
jgi:hypothetical protein